MSDTNFEDLSMTFDENDYDLDGLVRLVDSEETSMVLVYYDPDDDRYYRNRYDILECDRGISYTLRKIDHYLDQDEEQGLFIAFAATYEGQLRLLNGMSFKEEELNLGDLELGEQLVYGMLVHKEDGQYYFDEVLYHDGGEKSQSWAEVIDDAGVLTREIKKLIAQFA